MKILQIILFFCIIQFTQERIFKNKFHHQQKESKKIDLIFDQKKPQIIIQPHGTIDKVYSSSSRIKQGEVPELKPQPIQQNYPIFQIDKKKGLSQFGAIAADLFKMDPNDILNENEMHESLDQFKDSLEESKMKYPILIPPTILKSMVFYLKKIDQFREKEKQDEELKNKDKNSVNLTEEIMQEKKIAQRMENNEKDIKHLETAIKGLTDSVASLRAQKIHQEQEKEQEEKLAKLKKEQKAEQKKQAILIEEEKIEQDLIALEKEEQNIENLDISDLENRKKILTDDLKKLSDKENSEQKLVEIEKALEQIDVLIQQKTENTPENQKEQLLKQKEELMLKEQEQAQKFIEQEVIEIEGDLNASQMKSAKKQMKSFKEIIQTLLKKLPSKNKLIYKNDYDLYLKLVIDLHNFQRLFNQYNKFSHSQLRNLMNKIRQIEFTTEGIVKYLDQNKVYQKIRQNTYPNDAKIFNWDHQLSVYTDKLVDSFKLFINNIQIILNNLTSIESILNQATLEEEKQGLYENSGDISINEEMFDKKKNIVEQVNDNLVDCFKKVRKIIDDTSIMRDNENFMKDILQKMNDYISEKEIIENQEKLDRERQEQLNNKNKVTDQTIQDSSGNLKKLILYSILFIVMI